VVGYADLFEGKSADLKSSLKVFNNKYLDLEYVSTLERKLEEMRGTNLGMQATTRLPTISTGSTGSTSRRWRPWQGRRA
jgi:hypothetical protein